MSDKSVTIFYPKSDFILPSGIPSRYNAWLDCSCGHKGRKFIAYEYYTALTKNGNFKTRWLNYKYTFKVCRKCFEKNHTEWMIGNNLPKKYLDKEILYFQNVSNVKSSKMT